MNRALLALEKELTRMPHDHTNARQLASQRIVKNTSAAIPIKQKLQGAQSVPPWIFEGGEAANPNTLGQDVLDDDLAWTIEQVCDYFGGLNPVHPSTIYKWIKKKGFPKPFKPGPRTSRWLKSEIVAYRRNMVVGRGEHE